MTIPRGHFGVITIIGFLSAWAIGYAVSDVDRRIERVKSEYSKAVQAARDDFGKGLDDLISEYTRQGDLDAALSIRSERDAFFEKNELTVRGGEPMVRVQDGWTILLCSDDPLLWNIPILNAQSYAVSLSKAPRDMRYLRVRRMDTKQSVIVSCSVDALRELRIGPRSYWRGDKRLNRQACCLGIVDGTKRAPTSLKLAVTRDGDFGGWGFGAFEGGEERQGYLWDGLPIDRTVLEIAVTARKLEPQEYQRLRK
jgi:hypothetical protein